MGSLAKYGALAGLADSVVEQADRAAEQRAKTAEEEREERILAWEAGVREQAAADKADAAQKLEATRNANAEARNVASDERQATRESANITQRAEEQRKTNAAKPKSSTTKPPAKTKRITLKDRDSIGVTVGETQGVHSNELRMDFVPQPDKGIYVRPDVAAAEKAGETSRVDIARGKKAYNALKEHLSKDTRVKALRDFERTFGFLPDWALD